MCPGLGIIKWMNGFRNTKDIDKYIYSRRTRPELVSSYSHRRRIWGFFIIYCRSLSAFSSIEVYLTAISRTDLCTRHSTVQYSTVQYTEYSTIALVSNVCSGWPSPCWSCPAPPSPRTRCPTHTRTRAPPPCPAETRVVPRDQWPAPASPQIMILTTIMKLTATLLVIIIIVRNKNASIIYCPSPYNKLYTKLMILRGRQTVLQILSKSKSLHLHKDC